MPECDAAFGEVVGGHGNRYTVADGDPNEMLTHFAGNVREDHVSVLQLHIIESGRGWYKTMKRVRILLGDLRSGLKT